MQKQPLPVTVNPLTVDGPLLSTTPNAAGPNPGDGPPAVSMAAETLLPANRGKNGDKPPYKKKVIAEKAPPGMESWVLRRKNDFKSRYGDRADEVLYATAWKLHNKKSLNESVEQFDDISAEFISFASAYLNLDTVPPITFKSTEPGSTFATWSPDGISVSVTERHPMDVFRSLAHELVHQKQHETDVLHSESGQTGSDHENEANAMAGIIMRDFAKANPSMFGMKSISEGFFGKTRRKRPAPDSLNRVLAKAVDAKIKERSGGIAHQRKLELIAAKAKASPKKASAPAPAENHEKQINHHLTQIDRMLTAKEKATSGATTRLHVDGKTHDVPNREFYDKVAGWHQRTLKSKYGVDVEIKEKPKAVSPPKPTRKPPPALAEDVSSREKTCLLRKSHISQFEYGTLLEVYIRGLNDWDYSQVLTREQYAFNRVNSFCSGGKAIVLDSDLVEET